MENYLDKHRPARCIQQGKGEKSIRFRGAVQILRAWSPSRTTDLRKLTANLLKKAVEKALAENRPFSLTGDSFPKIIVRHDIRKRWYDEQGVLNIGILDFLLDEGIV